MTMGDGRTKCALALEFTGVIAMFAPQASFEVPELIVCVDFWA